MSSTKLRKLGEKGFKLVYKIVLSFVKEWNIFLRLMNLYCREQKIRVNDNNVVGGKSEIQLSLEVSWKKGRNEFRLIFDSEAS